MIENYGEMGARGTGGWSTGFQQQPDWKGGPFASVPHSLSESVTGRSSWPADHAISTL